MTTVSKSAAISATQLFGTITTTANALSTGINAVGNVFDELHLRSTERLKNVRLDLNVTGETNRKRILLTAAQEQLALITDLAKDPNLAKVYEDLLSRHPVN